MNPQVDEFISKAKKWQTEFEKLRRIVLDCNLEEELKWYQPCYTYKGNNILIISGFKEYCILGFFKGSLLNDPYKILSKPGENTQSGRQARFTNLEEIEELETVLKQYIFEAIEVEKEGLKVSFKKTSEFEIPEELQTKFKENPVFKTAFEKLTPGRQRAYLLHFSAPKQSTTREARIEKYIAMILNGKGLND